MYGNSCTQGMHDVDHMFKSMRVDSFVYLTLLNNSGTVTTLTLSLSLLHLIERITKIKIIMFFIPKISESRAIYFNRLFFLTNRFVVYPFLF